VFPPLRDNTISCRNRFMPGAARFADRIALLQNGRLMAMGESADILGSSAMRDVFQVEFMTERLEGDRIEIRSMQLIASE
jgi:ABC-type cobalamin transport system ATPase subunit